jgi:hypothetical protein
MIDQKEAAWQQNLEKYSRISDKRNMPIDAGILQMVVVLNLLDIRTTASCEGHINWGTGAPWIHIRAEDPNGEDQRVTQARQEALRQETLKQLPREEIDRLFSEMHQIAEQAEQKHRRLRLMELLTAFYADRQVPYDIRLSIQNLGVISRLESQGASVIKMYPHSIREQKLLAYQQEMQEFTAFLKQCYWEKSE